MNKGLGGENMDHGFLENLLEFWINPHGITWWGY